ncbi:MAG: TetR/AcrR family transcriptional regulator [Bacteroidales bacterium]
MSPRTSEQYSKLRAEKQKAIMEVAIEIFAEKTYQGASVSMIAKKAGISKGLLYNYFINKDALLKEIVKNGSHKVWQYFDPNRDGILTPEEFIFFIKKSIQVVKENVNYWKLYSALLLQPTVIDIIKNEFDDTSVHYGKLILELFKERKIDDPEGEILLMSAMIKGAIVQFLAMPELFPIAQFENKIINYYKEKLRI